MFCPKCGFQQPEGVEECSRCGIIFAKIREHTGHSGPSLAPPAVPSGKRTAVVGELFCAVEPGESLPFVAGRGLLLAIMSFWGWRLISHPPVSNYAGEMFLHLVNLPFHEAGHVIFSFFGRFMHVFGGSLMQWLVPLTVTVAFLLKRNPFAASVCLWWCGESLIDIAPYINDARAGQLMLLGGVTGSEVEDYHDWEVILRSLGLLHQDHAIAWTAHILGAVLMSAAFLWSGYVVYRQYRMMIR